MTTLDLPAPLQTWVEQASGLPVTAAAAHLAGANRDAWNVDVGQGEARRALFLLRDKGGSGGSGRDAAVLRALAGTALPVPEVVGHDDALAAILLERVPGRSDFPQVDHESEREPTARHLMELTGALHCIDPASVKIEHLSVPTSARACALEQLAPVRQAVDSLGDWADPLFGFALDWLERNIPSKLDRVSLVHSDMGPGNFLAQAGRVTAIVDWEVAHFGDPMEDLAALACRDMSTPVGHLPTRMREYQESSGIEVDLERVGYYRALVLTRNSLLISLGLANPPPTFDVIEMTMYQTLLMRAAALVICDNLGVERPVLDAPAPADAARTARTARSGWIAAMRRDVDELIRPVLSEGLASRRAAGIERGLATLDHEDRVGSELDRLELDDLAQLLGRRPSDVADGEAALRAHVDAGSGSDDRALALYFARRLGRLAGRRRPLMGALADQEPQPLEDP